ncbi:hypothetical protein K438DRAFT_1991403 [Mycena galopus ATCC 62051]|nr:hypothetical protein K438DRAFT_1991403 [Mycena galopus ATCC 62051]
MLTIFSYFSTLAPHVLLSSLLHVLASPFYQQLDAQRTNHYPYFRALLAGGTRLAYGAHASLMAAFSLRPGWISRTGPWLATGVVNTAKVKGTHTAMRLRALPRSILPFIFDTPLSFPSIHSVPVLFLIITLF